MDEMKWCSWCGKDKPVESGFFKRRRKLKSGGYNEYVMTWCKDCERERVKAWRKANPEKAQAMWARQRQKLDPEAVRRYKREWWRMTHGKGFKVWKKYAAELVGDDIRVRAKEFGEWLLWVEKELAFNTEKESYQLRGNGPTGRWTWRLVAEKVDVDYKILWRLKTGRSKTVSLTLVDKVGHLLGYPDLSVYLYPLGEEEPGKSQAA